MNCSNLCFDLSFSNWRWLLTCRQNVTWWISKDLPTEYTSACTYRHLCSAPHFAMQMCDLQVQYGFFCVQEVWGRIWARALNSSPVLAIISVTRGKSCLTSSIPQHKALKTGVTIPVAPCSAVWSWREAGSTPDTLSSAFPYGNVVPFHPGEMEIQRDAGIHSEPVHYQRDSGLGSAPDTNFVKTNRALKAIRRSFHHFWKLEWKYRTLNKYINACCGAGRLVVPRLPRKPHCPSQGTCQKGVKREAAGKHNSTFHWF